MTDDIVTRLQDIASQCWCAEKSQGEPVGKPFFRCESCDDQLQAAAEIVRLRALVDDYAGGINWHTTCTNCAKLMDVNYDQYCEIDRLRAAGDQLADYVREAGPGLHDDMAILACWQEARRG